LNIETITAKSRRSRIAAMFAAALIVFVQLAGAAHFHSFGDSRHSTQAQISADADFCPVCLVAFHAPAAAAPVIAQFSPAIEKGPVLTDGHTHISRIAFEVPLGRAPPVSL
jgi:hypothetical protein